MVSIERTSDKSGRITPLHRYPDPAVNFFYRMESITRKTDLAPNDRNPKTYHVSQFEEGMILYFRAFHREFHATGGRVVN